VIRRFIFNGREFEAVLDPPARVRIAHTPASAVILGRPYYADTPDRPDRARQLGAVLPHPHDVW